MDIKQKLAKIVELTNSDLSNYWSKEIGQKDGGFGFNQRQKTLVRKILSHAKEHNLRPAKRLRAAFVYYGYLLGQKGIDERILAPMRAVELVHTALLIQDDVMDQDEIRRGKLTTHKYFENGDKHYGESVAYCLGDAVLTLGFEELLKAEFDKKLVNQAAIKMMRGITNTVYGQVYDISLEKYGNWKEDDIMALHKAKTAIYTYENPLFIGAILGGVNDSVLGILHRYSMAGGAAFQIQDDILGMFGDSQKTGKSESSDLLQGKVTLLTVKTLKLGSPVQKEALTKVWGKRKAKKYEIEAAKKAIVDCGALEYSKKVSINLAKEAAKIAESLNQKKVNIEAVEFIRGIAEYMVNREF
jgi:geranylgeranyl diphosphate synthase type I